MLPDLGQKVELEACLANSAIIGKGSAPCFYVPFLITIKHFTLMASQAFMFRVTENWLSAQLLPQAKVPYLLEFIESITMESLQKL